MKTSYCFRKSQTETTTTTICKLFLFEVMLHSKTINTQFLPQVNEKIVHEDQILKICQGTSTVFRCKQEIWLSENVIVKPESRITCHFHGHTELLDLQRSALRLLEWLSCPSFLCTRNSGMKWNTVGLCCDYLTTCTCNGDTCCQIK